MGGNYVLLIAVRAIFSVNDKKRRQYTKPSATETAGSVISGDTQQEFIIEFTRIGPMCFM